MGPIELCSHCNDYKPRFHTPCAVDEKMGESLLSTMLDRVGERAGKVAFIYPKGQGQVDYLLTRRRNLDEVCRDEFLEDFDFSSLLED